MCLRYPVSATSAVRCVPDSAVSVPSPSPWVAMATVPTRAASMNASRPTPSGLTTPAPVMTTRRSGQSARRPGSRPRTSAQLFPPKAKEFDTATSTAAGHDTLGTTSRRNAAGSATLTVGGSTPSRSASTLTAASIAPAAPSVCPIWDLVLLIGGGPPSPAAPAPNHPVPAEPAPDDSAPAVGAPAKRASTALVSALSLAGVPVPWPLM